MLKPPSNIIKRSESQALSITQCLAKTYRDNQHHYAGRNVVNHCHIVGEVARALISRMPHWLKQDLFPEGSELVIENKNPFGIRYFGDNVPSRIDDWHNLAFSKNWIKLYSDCKITHCKYVKFKSIWHSFRYHSLFMVGTPNNPSHYVGYINDGTWVDWLNALEKGGYATSDAYRYTLRNIIIRYKLYLLDKHKIYI